MVISSNNALTVQGAVEAAEAAVGAEEEEEVVVVDATANEIAVTKAGTAEMIEKNSIMIPIALAMLLITTILLIPGPIVALILEMTLSLVVLMMVMLAGMVDTAVAVMTGKLLEIPEILIAVKEKILSLLRIQESPVVVEVGAATVEVKAEEVEAGLLATVVVVAGEDVVVEIDMAVIATATIVVRIRIAIAAVAAVTTPSLMIPRTATVLIKI
jgi:hypothetical protein